MAGDGDAFAIGGAVDVVVAAVADKLKPGELPELCHEFVGWQQGPEWQPLRQGRVPGNQIVHPAFDVGDAVEQMRGGSPDVGVSACNMRQANVLVLLGKLAAGGLERTADAHALVVAGWRFNDVARKGGIAGDALELCRAVAKGGCVSEALFQAAVSAEGPLIEPLEPGLVEWPTVGQLKAGGKALGFVVERLVVVEEQPRRLNGPVGWDCASRAAHQLARKPNDPFEREIHAPVHRVVVVERQVEGEAVRRRHSIPLRVADGSASMGTTKGLDQLRGDFRTFPATLDPIGTRALQGLPSVADIGFRRRH